MTTFHGRMKKTTDQSGLLMVSTELEDLEVQQEEVC